MAERRPRPRWSWLLDEWPERRLAAVWFVRGMALVYALAFASLGTQIVGLGGTHGVVPVAPLLQGLRQFHGPGVYAELPSLLWFGASDRALQATCLVGVLLSVLMFFRVACGFAALALWGLYLSFVTLSRAGFPFLSFQWDSLLLDAGLLVLFVAPFRLRPAAPRGPSRVAYLGLALLLFRLMFASGFVKLASHDELWRSLTALEVHFETQPLPTVLGWYAHQLPAPWLRLATAMMFGIELIVPYFLFAPRRLRHAAVALLVLLQLLIAATGNYGFFNVLTIVLCLPLLEDSWWRRLVPARGRKPASLAPAGEPPTPRVAGVLSGLLALAVLGGHGLRLADQVDLRGSLPRALTRPLEGVAPLVVFRPYGLFARMTRARREIVIEASQDGLHWTPYRFRYQPGDPEVAPRWSQPHMPRLDWQMWFAALQTSPPDWFRGLLEALRQGRPEVLDLLGDPPFPDIAPRWLRARSVRYRFTDLAHRRATGEYYLLSDSRLHTPPG